MEIPEIAISLQFSSTKIVNQHCMGDTSKAWWYCQETAQKTSPKPHKNINKKYIYLWGIPYNNDKKKCLLREQWNWNILLLLPHKTPVKLNGEKLKVYGAVRITRDSNKTENKTILQAPGYWKASNNRTNKRGPYTGSLVELWFLFDQLGYKFAHNFPQLGRTRAKKKSYFTT